MSDELHDQIRSAFADLEQQAPSAPSLSDLTAGRARLTAKVQRKWNNAAILVAAAAVTIGVVGVAVLLGGGLGNDTSPLANSTTTGPPESSPTIYGVWILDSYTYEGQTVQADTLIFDEYGTAYVEITADSIGGHSGCNSFGSQAAPSFDGTTLTFGEVAMNAMGCMGQTSEPAMSAALWSPDGVTVSLTRDTMTWTTDSVVLTFRRSTLLPSPTAPEWPQEFGRLDCSPSWVISQRIPGDLVTETLPTMVSGVVSVEGDGTPGTADPFVWGLDIDGTVIAGAAVGDVQPAEYQLVACAGSFGLAEAVDPVGAVLTWVNQLGLGQTSIQVWDMRLPEICSWPASNQGDYLPLADRYLVEDAGTSLRAGGDLPDNESVAVVLAMIRGSHCEAGPSSPTTTIPPFDSCSTDSLREGAALEESPGSYQGLPEAVLDTRDRLIRSALACDFADLVALVLASTDGDYSDAHFWGAAGSVEVLARYDADYGVLRQLVVALTTLPFSVTEGQRYDEATQTAVPEIYYSWPPGVELVDGQSLSDVWDADLLQAVADLNNVTIAELVRSTDEFGFYAGFRVGIAADGRWREALAGD